MLCVSPGNFVIAAARDCRGGQSPAPFTEVKPSTDDSGNSITYLNEDSEYDDEQARLAGIQRLLTIAGYDATPIDGVDGPKTQAALAKFLSDRGLQADASQGANFFETLLAAAQSPSSAGLTWCNDTPHRVMAAVGVDDGKTMVSRGWYRIEPGKCLHPRHAGPAEARVELCRGGRRRRPRHAAAGKPLNWGGATMLCTRDIKFEFTEQGDCGTRGLAATGFAAVDFAGGAGKTVRFALP